MTRAGALLLLCAALLLIAGGKCDDICPALRDTVDLFISGSHEAYIEQVEKYNQNPDVLETANTLKSCVDEKLTPQDKQDALSALCLTGEEEQRVKVHVLNFVTLWASVYPNANPPVVDSAAST
ncbi:PREDICTED: major allergen I polypeptide chain 1-like [Capra hircus]|uniref:major allergen I polypeptide chain 1-like n=1 Tax=Capra hircus TaxID=9925 RepID=UPI000846A5DE|nr:PREDICTED: major allergen I polypeptide chain 1-like [Capra hircus]